MLNIDKVALPDSWLSTSLTTLLQIISVSLLNLLDHITDDLIVTRANFNTSLGKGSDSDGGINP